MSSLVWGMKKASQLIQARTSWRSCTGEPIPEYKLKQLHAFVKSKSTGLFQQPLRFELVAAQAGDSDELKGLGTYGFIRKPSGFIVGAVERDLDNLEDYGLLLEDIVLFATSLGLATCWLGGTFQKDNFSARINTQPHEVVPAVISVGIGANNRNMVDRLIRNVAGSKRRLPPDQLFFEADGFTPLDMDTLGSWQQVLEMVRLSPSASNKQPWRLVKDHEQIHFFLQRTRGYRKAMFSDLQRIDMGIAMSHFWALVQELGLAGSWERITPKNVFPDLWEYTITWSF